MEGALGKMARPLIFCGPLGAGKSTLVKLLMKDYPGRFGFSVSHTSRQPRNGEIHGVHYHFDTIENIEREITMGKFIESAKFGGNIYGTSRAAVEEVCKLGKVCILDIDVEGVRQMKKTALNPLYVFVKSPTFQELERRLRLRGTETEESLKKRMQAAINEVIYGEVPGNFDLLIVNDVLEEAYRKLKTFVESQVLKKLEE